MTAPVQPRRSTPLGTKIENISTLVMVKLAGLAIFGASGFLLYREVMVPPSHTAHILIFTGIGILGLMFMFPLATTQALKALVGLASPYLGKWASRNNDSAGNP